MMMMNSNI